MEAKGTESDGLTVLVTAGEVAWAEQHPGECVLGVVSGIKFDAAGSLDKNTGSLTEYDLRMDTYGPVATLDDRAARRNSASRRASCYFDRRGL